MKLSLTFLFGTVRLDGRTPQQDIQTTNEIEHRYGQWRQH